MIILKEWIKELGYETNQLEKSHYLCKEINSFLIPIKTLKLGFNFPRNVYRATHINGMVKNQAENILKGIFDNQYLPPIEVYLEYDYINDYYYKLADGYHRYTISRYLNFKYIPVKIEKKFIYEII